jgi:cytochrome c biogenesis protein CcmG/thiol:disulfide interchange protein DsbE
MDVPIRRIAGVILALSMASASKPVAAAEPVSLAPAFVLHDLDGKTVRSSEFKGKPVVLDFWATWCQPCRASMPHLNTIHERLGQRGLIVLGISVDDGGPQRVRRFADRLGVKFRLAMADERVLDQYGPIRSIPTTFFIDRRGQVVRRVVGYIDPETMESYALELFDH